MRKQKRLLALLAAIALLVSSIGFAEEPAEVAAEEEPVVALEGALVEEGPSELEEMAEEGADAPGEDFAKDERGEKPAEEPAEEPMEESVEELPAEPVAEPLPAERMATELGLSIEGLAADLGVSVEELFLMDSEALGELYMRIHADEYGTMPVASSDFKTTTTWDGDLITILQEYTGTDTSVIIPDDIDVIEAGVFKGMTDIREIVLPADLTTIYGGAFEGCTGLTSIEFPVNVEYIGAAFVDCVNLEEVKFQGDKLTKMSGTFKNCTSLQTISIPASIESLEYGVFEGCESLYSVDFNKSKSLTAIGTSVFSGCKSLTDIDIPDSVQTIGFGAFADCESLEDPGLSIYSDLQNIGESAFSRCTSLKSVTLPGDLSFEGWAFNDCTNLASVVFKGTGMDAIPEGMFHGCSSLKSFEFPESVTSIGMSAFEGSGLTAIAIPEHVTDIGQEAFQGCKALETVKLHSGLKSVGGFAFAETGVKSVEIPYGITEIWERMFCDCASLKTVQLPDTVTSIQYGAFEGCALLENIQLPSGLTSLEGYALSGTAIRSVTIPGGVTTISYDAFSYCKSLTTVDICDGVETIGRASFDGCDALTLMRVPSSVIDIDVLFSTNSRNITMEVASDSAALEFCKEHFIKYRVNDCLEYGHSWKYDKNGESTGVCEDCGYECPHVETFVELGSDDAKKKPIVYDRNYHVTKSSLYRTVVCVECYKTVKSEKVCSAAGILEPHEYDYEEGPNEEYMPYGPCIFCGYDPEKDTSEPCKHKNTIVWYDFDEDCSFTWVDGKTHRVTGGVTTVTECEDCDYENRMHEEVEDKPFNHTCYEEGICDLCEGSVICEHPSWKFGEVYGESVNRYCVNINDPNIHETHIVAAYRECTECGYQVTAVDEEKIIQEKHILDGSGSCKACGYSPTKPKSVSITAPVKTVDIGGTIQLSATFKPEGTSDTLLWYSSNHAVATVDSRGIVTGMGAGSAKITAKMTSGKKSKSLKITVFDPEAPKKLALPKTLAFNLGETVDLKARLTELEPATAKLEWSSSNAEVVDVDPDSGTAVMLRSGKATVSVTGANAGGKMRRRRA